MAKRKRHSAAEIAAKLLEADALSAKGQTQAELAKALGISVMTIYRWRKMREQDHPPSRANGVLDQFRKTNSAAASLSRIAQFQLENARLRKLVTDLLLEKISREDDQMELRVGAKSKPANKRRRVQACGAEFCRVAIRNKIHGRSAPTSATGVETYDEKRPQQRRWCIGKTPKSFLTPCLSPTTRRPPLSHDQRSTGGSDPIQLRTRSVKPRVPHLMRPFILAGSLRPTCNTPSPLKFPPSSSTTQTSPL
jgi:putative transposase